MATKYMVSAVKGAACGSVIGAVLGLWSGYADAQRRQTHHIGMPSLAYLDQHDQLVYALSHIQQSHVKINRIATLLNGVAELIVRRNTEQYKGHLMYALNRKVHEARQELAEVVAAKGKTYNPHFEEHIKSIQIFLQQTEHNNALGDI
jgi:hypothetical protein